MCEGSSSFSLGNGCAKWPWTIGVDVDWEFPGYVHHNTDESPLRLTECQ